MFEGAINSMLKKIQTFNSVIERQSSSFDPTSRYLQRFRRRWCHQRRNPFSVLVFAIVVILVIAIVVLLVVEVVAIVVIAIMVILVFVIEVVVLIAIYCDYGRSLSPSRHRPHPCDRRFALCCCRGDFHGHSPFRDCYHGQGVRCDYRLVVACVFVTMTAVVVTP